MLFNVECVFNTVNLRTKGMSTLKKVDKRRWLVHHLETVGDHLKIKIVAVLLTYNISTPLIGLEMSDLIIHKLKMHPTEGANIKNLIL